MTVHLVPLIISVMRQKAFFFVVMLMASFLVSCLSYLSYEAPLEEKVDAWVGFNINGLIDACGYYNKTLEGPNENTVYVYEFELENFSDSASAYFEADSVYSDYKASDFKQNYAIDLKPDGYLILDEDSNVYYVPFKDLEVWFLEMNM